MGPVAPRSYPIESYRQGDVLIFRDRSAKTERSAPAPARASSETPADRAVDIGEEAKVIIARLRSVDRRTPNIDRTVVEHAIFEHLAALGLPVIHVRWVEDAETAHGVVLNKVTNAAEGAAQDAAWIMAEGAVRNAAWNAADGAARIAARVATESWTYAAEYAAWRAAWRAAWIATRKMTWNAPQGVAGGAAENAGWSAARGAARGTARSAAIDRACAVWAPLVDAYIAGLWLYWICEDEVVAVPRPTMHLDGDQLHRADGPAVEWPNGRRYWFWRGVQVPEDVVHSPGQITPERIDGERNVEVRRVLIERYGVERYIRVGAKELHRDRFGVLLRKQVDGDEPIVLVQVTNSTPEPDGSSKVYLLRVHPELRPMLDGGRFGEPQAMTAHNAVASTFGLTGAQYDPVVQT